MQISMRFTNLLVACCICHVACTVVVTVQSQSPEQMQALTDAVEQHADFGTMDLVLGPIEATVSRVVSSTLVEATFNVSPVMARLTEMQYNNITHEWTVQYEAMRHDPSDLTNVYNRTLYLTRTGTPAVIADTQNPFLRSMPVAEQEHLFLQNYIAAPGGGDAVIFAQDGLSSSEVGIPGSLRSVLTIRIPHEFLVRSVGTEGLQDNAEWGFARTWTFGIGMAFRSETGANLVLFDRFHLLERSADIFHVQAETQYSLARHIEFYSLDAGSGVRVAFFHFTLGSGKKMNNIYATVNGVRQHPSTCLELQARIDALPDKKCLLTYPLCALHVQQIGQVQTVSFAIPMHGESMRTDLMLNITDHVTAQTLIAAVNFNVGASSSVCQDAVVALHDPLKWVTVDLYRNTGHGLSLGTPLSGTGDSGTLMTNLMLTVEAEIMSQALFALVLRPGSSPEAAAYFASTADTINLDSVIMSHAHNQATPPPAPSRILPVGPRNLRSRIDFSEEAQAICPRETAQLAVAECVTTEDWAWTGPLQRPLGGQYFVHETGDEASDRAFLQRVFGSDGVRDATAGIIDAFYAESNALRVAHAKIFWVWPIYNWQRSPIALVDRTIVSLSWSLTPYSAVRHLLQVPATAKLATWQHAELQSSEPTLRHVKTHCIFCSNHTNSSVIVRRVAPRVRRMLQMLSPKSASAEGIAVRRRATRVTVPVSGNDY